MAAAISQPGLGPSERGRRRKRSWGRFGTSASSDVGSSGIGSRWSSVGWSSVGWSAVRRSSLSWSLLRSFSVPWSSLRRLPAAVFSEVVVCPGLWECGLREGGPWCGDRLSGGSSLRDLSPAVFSEAVFSEAVGFVSASRAAALGGIEPEAATLRLTPAESPGRHRLGLQITLARCARAARGSQQSLSIISIFPAKCRPSPQGGRLGVAFHPVFYRLSPSLPVASLAL